MVGWRVEGREDISEKEGGRPVLCCSLSACYLWPTYLSCSRLLTFSALAWRKEVGTGGLGRSWNAFCSGLLLTVGIGFDVLAF